MAACADRMRRGERGIESRQGGRDGGGRNRHGVGGGEKSTRKKVGGGSQRPRDLFSQTCWKVIAISTNPTDALSKLSQHFK